MKGASVRLSVFRRSRLGHGAVALREYGVRRDVRDGRLNLVFPTGHDLCLAGHQRVPAIAGDVGGIALPQSVSGTARCDGTALLLPLASQAGTESIALRIEGAGTYRAELSLRPSDPLAVQKLEQAGVILKRVALVSARRLDGVAKPTGLPKAWLIETGPQRRN